MFRVEEFDVKRFVPEEFNLILSLSVHHWMGDIDAYIRNLRSLMAADGFLLLESHNLHEPHHRSDWNVVLAALDSEIIVKRKRIEETLTYPGLEMRPYNREFLLVGGK